MEEEVTEIKCDRNEIGRFYKAADRPPIALSVLFGFQVSIVFYSYLVLLRHLLFYIFVEMD